MSKNIDWEQEYNKLAKAYDELQRGDKTNEIIRRLDVIGDMLGDIARDNELRFKKEKMENAKREYEMWFQEYNGYRNDYKNTYRERI